MFIVDLPTSPPRSSGINEAADGWAGGTPQHLRFRAALRAFLQRDLAPLAEAFEASGKDPPGLPRRAQ